MTLREPAAIALALLVPLGAEAARQTAGNGGTAPPSMRRAAVEYIRLLEKTKNRFPSLQGASLSQKRVEIRQTAGGVSLVARTRHRGGKAGPTVRVDILVRRLTFLGALGSMMKAIPRRAFRRPPPHATNGEADLVAPAINLLEGTTHTPQEIDRLFKGSTRSARFADRTALDVMAGEGMPREVIIQTSVE